MPLSSRTLLSPEARAALAAESDFGGGNLWRTALEHSRAPDSPVLVTEGPLVNQDGAEQAEFSIAQLDAFKDAWSAWYFDRGVRPRDRVVVWRDDSFENHPHLAALAQLGAIAVTMNGRLEPDLALRLMHRADPVGLYTDATHLALLAGRERELPSLRWAVTRDDVGKLGSATPPETARYRHSPADPVFLCHSSGTTGIPKLVTWSHQQSVAGPKFRLSTHPEAEDAVMLCAAPLSHGAAIAITFYALLAGLPLVSYADTGAAGLARGAARHRPTTVFAFNQTFSALAVSDPDPADFASVTNWMNVGDSAHEAHIQTLIRLGRHRDENGVEREGSVFNDALGSSELGWAALRRAAGPDSPSWPRYLGRPVPVMEVAVLREDGSVADVDEVGRLGVRGESVTTGYWNDSDTFYRTMLGGYWLSGDMVRRTADDDYFHVDRIVDMIPAPDADGHSIYMEDRILLAVPEAADCAVVAGGDAGLVVPVAVLRLRDAGPGPTDRPGENDPAKPADTADMLARANAALAADGQPEVGLLEVVSDDADFPVGPTGKVLKRVLREKYADLSRYLGREQRAAAEKLRDVVTTVADVEAEHAELDADFHERLGMDSLRKTEFVGRVEKAFATRFDIDDVAGMRSLADVLAVLTRTGVVAAPATPPNGLR